MDAVPEEAPAEAKPAEITLRHGHRWQIGISDTTIELTCYRELRANPKFVTGHTKGYHFERAIQLLWPERTEDGRRCYIMTPWSERRIQSWCEWNFQTWWGPASAGKTKDGAICLMTHYLSAPDITAISVCSTDKKMLMRRIFGELVRLYYIYPDSMPMEYLRGEPSFKYRPPGTYKSTSSNAGIFGVPIIPGHVDKAIGRIIGAHNAASVLVCDELQASYSEVVEQGWDNISSGCEIDGKFLGMGNPINKMDPLCKASKPKASWDSISPELESWETEKGICLYFDGLKSPGVTNPEKYPFLLNQHDIDEMRKDPGENSPRFWSQRRGFLPPDGLIRTLYSPSLIAQHALQRKEIRWRTFPTRLAALDESFSVDGDRCMLITAEIGMTTDGLMIIFFYPELVINLELSDKEAIEYFVVRKVKEHCEANGILQFNFGLDITGSQTAMASIIEREWGAGIFRCQFGGSATDTEISRDDKSGKVLTAKDVYANRVTELWYNHRRFAISGQIAGMSDGVCLEACQRILLQRGGKVSVETKKEMKKRTGCSPDIMDGHVIIIAMAMERFGMRPGTNNFGDSHAPIPDEVLGQLSSESESGLYEADQVPDDEEELRLDSDVVL